MGPPGLEHPCSERFFSLEVRTGVRTMRARSVVGRSESAVESPLVARRRPERARWTSVENLSSSDDGNPPPRRDSVSPVGRPSPNWSLVPATAAWQCTCSLKGKLSRPIIPRCRLLLTCSGRPRATSRTRASDPPPLPRLRTTSAGNALPLLPATPRLRECLAPTGRGSRASTALLLRLGRDRGARVES